MSQVNPTTQLLGETVKLIASLNPLHKSKSKPPTEVLAREEVANIFVIEATPSLIDELRVVTINELNTKLQKEKKVLKYKPVAQKKRPVPSVIPKSVKVVRHFPSDLLEFLLNLLFQAPTFVPTVKITADVPPRFEVAPDSFNMPS